MKRLLIFLIISSVLVSCGKISTSKLSGTWNVTSYEQTYTYTSSNSQFNMSRTIKHDGKQYVLTEKNSDSTFSKTYQIKLDQFEFSKDGSFKRLFNIQNDLSEVIKSEESGIWYFAEKSSKNDIGTHELIHLVTTYLKYNKTLGTTTLESYESNYGSQNSPILYKVLSSKGKKLELEVTTESSGNSSKSTTVTHYVLEK